MERATPELGTQGETTGDRVLAWFIDGIIIWVVGLPIAWLIGDLSTVIWIAGFGSFAYHTAFEAMYGQTFGKKAMNVVVVKENGDPCDWVAAAIRNLLRVVDAFLFYIVGVALILVTDDNQRLGDVVASTIVTDVAPGPPPHDDDEEEEDEEEEEEEVTVTTQSSEFVIELHEDDASGDRYIELVNQSGDEVDLSRATLRTAAGDDFRFPQGEAVHNPDYSKTFLIPDDFVIEPDDPVTLVTYMNERYEVAWG